MPQWPLVSVPPWQKHLSLMKCFPLRGHLAHTATRQLLSDKEGVGGQASRQVGLAVRLSSPGFEPQSSTPSASLGAAPLPRQGDVPGRCARRELGDLNKTPGGGERGHRPFGMGIPAPPPFAANLLPTANPGSRLCASPCAGSSARPVASEAQVCPQRDSQESPRSPQGFQPLGRCQAWMP